MGDRAMKNYRKIFATLFLTLLPALTFADTFNLFAPANGVLVGNPTTWVTTAATSSNIDALWIGSGCTGVVAMQLDGSCTPINSAINGNIAADSFVGNPTSSGAASQAFNPLQANILEQGGMTALVASTTNITLSGAQTIDGVPVSAGQSVMVDAQSTLSQNGLYTVQSGAWTRLPAFPAGFVLPQYCDISVFIQRGTKSGGLTFRLDTTPGPLTIGTSALGFTVVNLQTATSSRSGIVVVTSTTEPSAPVANVTQTPTFAGGQIDDCASFSEVTGSIQDFVALFCTYADLNGHPYPFNTGGSPPTTNHGSVACEAQDNTGCITGLSAVTSLVLTFGGSFTAGEPACALYPRSAAPVVTSATYSATGTGSVTFALTAFTGSLYYKCL